MTTKTIDTEQINQSIDLRDYAGRYTTLRGGQSRELDGPCPKCGGDDRFHCQADWFFCRICHEKRGDAIEFVMWLNGLPFKEAVATLANTPMPATLTRRAPAPKPQAEQPQDWQRKAEAITEQAHARLFDNDNKEAEVGRAYLDGRGIEPHVQQVFKLGFTPAAPLPGTKGEQRRPAIVIPWYRDGKIVGMRFRFLQWHEYTDNEGRERREKQTALTGSSFSGVLYGEQALDTGIAELSTLLIIEGEVNDMSVWQVSRYTHLDVLSLGSESASITPAMIEHAKKYATVMVWLDREERAQAIMAAFPNAYGIKSPTIRDPKGEDANDLLRTGDLGGFLARHRFQAAQDAHEQERLLWDLWDGAQAWEGTDKETALAINRIAKTLGKTVKLVEVAPGTWRTVGNGENEVRNT